MACLQTIIMYNKPHFKPHFHVEVVEPETVYLLSEQGHFALGGRLYVQLAPLLDGRHTVDEIVQQLKAEVSILAIYHALVYLESKGYLTEADYTLSDSEAAFWSGLDIDPRVAVNKLQNTKVSVITCGAVESDSFVSALEALNLQVDQAGDFTVVLTDDYLQVNLDELNKQALDNQKPWLLAKPVGSVIWLGPLFIPNQTGCWECLADRLRGNREVETAVQHQQKITTPFPTSRGILPSSLAIGINWAAMEVAKAIARGTHPQLEGKILTFDLANLSLQEHTLVKRPQCRVCGVSVDLDSQKPKPIVLNSHKKQFTADGGHRSLSPEQTLKKYEYHISPITGVVSALPKVQIGNNDLIQVYTAIHKNGEGKLDNLTDLRLNLRHKSAGKGKTDQQSKASGFCEAIERYSGIFTGDEIRIQGIYTELGSVAIHPNDCMQYSATQYQNRETLNSQQHTNFAWIPQPFDQEREIEWTPVWSLTNQTFKYVPTAYCYYDYPLPDDHCFCKGDSNGNAAGNTLEEAILQGFMELVERDSVAVWWYNRVQRPGVDLDSFDEPYFQALRDYYHTQNYHLWVIDITNDLGIPSFAALARRTDKTAEEILMGFGTHFDPKIAILRAVTELNQMYVVILNQPNDAQFDDPDMEYWMKNVTIENQPYLAPDRNAAPKVYADYPYLWSDDLRQDVLTCVDIVAKHGMETLILDQTRPDIGLNVVKVIVPGMRHFWPRFAPGRLYDVPVKLGWLPAPLKEEELNPIPMFC